MKTAIKKTMIILVSGLLISFNSSAKNKNSINTSNTINSVSEIKNHFIFPSFVQDANQIESVNVVFTVNETGNVNLVIANTTNLILKQSIESQFSKLKFTQFKANNAYGIDFKFKTI